MVLALLLSLAAAVPFVPQRKDTCGAASLAMVLGYWDVAVTQDAIAAELLLPELHGIAGSRLEAFARGKGLVAVAHAGDLAHLRHHVERGRPLIVAWHMGRGRYHNVVVVGFDEAAGAAIVHDPARGAARRVRLAEFDRRWAGAGRWTLLVAPASS